VDHKQTVQEADGGVSRVKVRIDEMVLEGVRYLRDGSLPKKATKVMKETDIVKIARYRSEDMTVAVQEALSISPSSWWGNKGEQLALQVSVSPWSSPEKCG
jgi:hypothetical protein